MFRFFLFLSGLLFFSISVGMESSRDIYFSGSGIGIMEKRQIIYIVNSAQLECKIDAENLRYGALCNLIDKSIIKQLLIHPQKYQPTFVRINNFQYNYSTVSVTDDDGTVYFPVRDTLGREVARVIPDNNVWGRYVPYPSEMDIDKGKLVIRCGEVVIGDVDLAVPKNGSEWHTILGGDVNTHSIINYDLGLVIVKSTIVQPENAGLHPNESIDIIQIKDLEDHQGAEEQMSLEEIVRIYTLELPGQSSTTTINPFLSNGLHTSGGCCLLI